MNLTPDSIAISLLIVVLIVDRVLGILKQRGIDLPKVIGLIEEHLPKMAEQVDRMHEIWYVRQSLENALTKLTTAIDKQTKAYERIDRRLADIERKVDACPKQNLD